MPSFETILTVSLAGFVLSLSPGPSMLYVLSRSIGQSRAAGLASALGLAIGGATLAVVAATGLALLFQNSRTLYTSVSILGALYIIYLGLKTGRTVLQTEQPSEEHQEPEKPIPKENLLRIVMQGILVEVLNPKTILFFMAFLPPFVDAEKGGVTQQLLILGFLVPLTALPSDLFIALLGGSIAEQIRKNASNSKILDGLGALILIGIGISVFFGL